MNLQYLLFKSKISSQKGKRDRNAKPVEQQNHSLLNVFGKCSVSSTEWKINKIYSANLKMKPHQSQDKIHNIYVQKCLNNKNNVPCEPTLGSLTTDWQRPLSLWQLTLLNFPLTLTSVINHGAQKTYHMAKRASKVVNGTAADEPSAHNTRFNRKKMPNINLKSQNTNNYKQARRLLWDCSN